VNDEQKMEVALSLAHEAMELGEFPVGAVVFHDNRIVASAYASERIDRRLLVHAELKALIALDNMGFTTAERRQMALYTTLEPCLMCFGAAMSCFIGEIVYSSRAPDDGVTKLLNFDAFDGDLVSRQIPLLRGPISRNESLKLIQRYCEHEKRAHLKSFAAAILSAN
jgi:tRNA(adenine34) deaminase